MNQFIPYILPNYVFHEGWYGGPYFAEEKLLSSFGLGR